MHTMWYVRCNCKLRKVLSFNCTKVNLCRHLSLRQPSFFLAAKPLPIKCDVSLKRMVSMDELFQYWFNVSIGWHYSCMKHLIVWIYGFMFDIVDIDEKNSLFNNILCILVSKNNKFRIEFDLGMKKILFVYISIWPFCLLVY